MTFSPIPLHILARWFFALTVCLVTLLALSRTAPQLITTGWDKTNHLLAFFALLWLLDFAWPAPGLMIRKLAILMAYGLLIEYIQAYTSYRTSSFWDWSADALGLLAYLALRPKLFRLRSVLQRLPFIDSDQTPSGG